MNVEMKVTVLRMIFQQSWKEQMQNLKDKDYSTLNMIHWMKITLSH